MNNRSICRQLCGHLAAALANHLVTLDGRDGPARKGDCFWHEFNNDFEAAATALEQLQVLVPNAREDGSTQSAFVVDAADMPGFVAVLDATTVDQLPDLLEVFLRVACGYGGLSDADDWFTPPPLWAVAMKQLAESGYATCEGTHFRWTTQVAASMQSAGLWNKAGRSLAQLRAVEQEREANLAWRTMPDTLRENIRSSRLGLIELVKIINHSWRDGAWHEVDPGRYNKLSESMALAQALIRRAQVT